MIDRKMKRTVKELILGYYILGTMSKDTDIFKEVFLQLGTGILFNCTYQQDNCQRRCDNEGQDQEEAVL